MPRRKRTRMENSKMSKLSSEEPYKRQKTEHNQEDSRLHFLPSNKGVKSESDDAVGETTLNVSVTHMSSDVLSANQQVSSDARNVINLKQNCFDQKQENKSKRQIHKVSTTQRKIMATQETRADNIKLLNAIESGEHCLAIELLKESHTFSHDELGNALIAACQHGHKYLVQKLVHLGANVQYKDKNGNTPLLISARNGFIDIVCFLMKKADVNACDSNGNTALILSIRSSGSKEIVKVLLTHKEININHQNKDGYTALMKALEAMDFDTVKILLEKYAGYNEFCPMAIPVNWNLLDLTVNCKGETAQQIAENNRLGNIWKLFKEFHGGRRLPLVSAYKACDTESFNILLDSQFLETNDMKSSVAEKFNAIVTIAVRNMQMINDDEIAMIMRLIEYGTEVKLSLHDGISRLLCAAVKFEKCNLVELLCKHLDQQKLKKRKRRYIHTLALTEAAKIGSCDLIKFLLRYKTIINTIYFSDSPIDGALSNGHIECAKLLIRRGAEIDIEDALESAMQKQVIKYIDFLCENYRQDICKYLSENSSHLNNKLLISAARIGNLEIIGHILDAGADVNGSDDYSEKTPLMESKDADVALFLIRRGADVNLETSEGNTPLLSVVMDSYGYCYKSGLIRVLIENGSSVNARNSKGETPLMLAASNNMSESILQTLLNYGANLNDQDDDGDTALIRAVRCGCLQNISILLQFAKNKDLLNIQNQKGRSALMYAVTSSNLKIVQELIYHGADVNIKDVNGNTALLHAISRYGKGMEEIMTTLIKAGSHVNCQNNNGISPLMLAASRCSKYPISILLDSGADVNAVSMKDNTKTAISFLTDNVEWYIGKDKLFCRKTVDISIKMFINENINANIMYLLERGACSSYIKSDFLHNMIFKKETTFISKLIQYVTPNRMMIRNTGIISTVSPLCAALLIGNVSLARYFFENMYMTDSDISSLTGNKDIRHILEQKKQEESVNFLNEISSQPFSLFQLSFVSVSSAVGPSPGRENRVNLLLLPQVIKDKLLFKSEMVKLNIPSESKTSTFSEMDLTMDTDDIYSTNWIDFDYHGSDTD